MLRSFDPLSVPRITFGQLGRKPSALKRSTTARSSSSSVSASNSTGAPIPATRRADCGQLCEAARPIAKAIKTGLGDYATRTWSDDLSERTPQTAKVNNSTNGPAQQIGSGVLCGRGNQHYFRPRGPVPHQQQALSLSAILESARSMCLQPDDRGTDERSLECYSGVAPTE